MSIQLYSSPMKYKDPNTGNYIDIIGISGNPGRGISSVELNNDYTLTITFTDGTSTTTNSIRGAQGVGIRSVEKTNTSGLVDTYTITFDDNTISTFQVTNGASIDLHICTQGEYDSTTRVPTIQNPDSRTFYLVPNEDSGASNAYTEWLYANGAWERFGAQVIDLSGYAAKEEVPIESGSGNGSARIKDGTFITNTSPIANIASGTLSFSEGHGSVASGDYAHSEGVGLSIVVKITGVEGSNVCNFAVMNNYHGYVIKPGAKMCYSVASQGIVTQYLYDITNVDYIANTLTLSNALDITCTNEEFLLFLPEYGASGLYSHVEGGGSSASSIASHAEGYNTIASGSYTHSEGYGARADGYNSHVEGYETIATGSSMHVSGTYNIDDDIDNYPEWIGGTLYSVGDKVKVTTVDQYNRTIVTGYICLRATSRTSIRPSEWSKTFKTTYASIVGNGTDEQNRSNAYALTWTGDGKYAGDIYVHANANSSGGTKVATIDDIAAIEVPVNDVQVNSVSVVENGVANVPLASSSVPGVVRVNSNYGFEMDGTAIRFKNASDVQLKAGTNQYRTISPSTQHQATFYGLSKAAGVDLANETVTLGTYPETSKTAIKSMLGVQDGLKVVRLI